MEAMAQTAAQLLRRRPLRRSLASLLASTMATPKPVVEAQSAGLTQTLFFAVTANSTTLGKTEVCTYADGSKVVTVTYLNDRVINVSRPDSKITRPVRRETHG